jgi:Pentapeptide repeats (8 copies)
MPLRGAVLFEADLRDARLTFADLSGANLDLSDLTYGNIRSAKNLNLETVRDAKNWDKAFYDPDTLKALALPLNHNDRLTEQQKKEKELQQKQSAEQIAASPLTSPKEQGSLLFRSAPRN